MSNSDVQSRTTVSKADELVTKPQRREGEPDANPEEQKCLNRVGSSFTALLQGIKCCSTVYVPQYMCFRNCSFCKGTRWSHENVTLGAYSCLQEKPRRRRARLPRLQRPVRHPLLVLLPRNLLQKHPPPRQAKYHLHQSSNSKMTLLPCKDGKTSIEPNGEV